MDAYYETGNQLNLLNYLTKLDSYILRFYERTQDSDFNIERPSAYLVCQECFGPHDIKRLHQSQESRARLGLQHA